MAVTLKRTDPSNAEVRALEQNVADAIEELASQPPPALGVLRISASRKLVGNEDVVLVDASTSTTEIFLVLPSPKVLQRALRVKVAKASTAFPVTLKAVDIPTTGSPTIDDANTVSIPVGETGSMTVVSDGKNFSTV